MRTKQRDNRLKHVRNAAVRPLRQQRASKAALGTLLHVRIGKKQNAGFVGYGLLRIVTGGSGLCRPRFLLREKYKWVTT